MLKEIQQNIEKGLRVFDNPLVFTLTVMFIGIYSSVIAPKLPSKIMRLFNNTVFKLFFFFVVVLVAHKDPRLALIISLAFVFTIQGLGKYNIKDDIKAVTGWAPTIIPSPSHSDPPASQPMKVESGAPTMTVEFDEEVADDGTRYVATGETEIGLPLHPDFIHSGAQAMGDPIAGWDESENLGAQY